MSFSSVWLQKLSIAIANQTAIGSQRRATVCSRQRALGNKNGESGGLMYNSVVEGRVGRKMVTLVLCAQTFAFAHTLAFCAKTIL